MGDRDWFDALLCDGPDFDLPPACPFGQEDYSENTLNETNDQDNSPHIQEPLTTATENPTEAANVRRSEASTDCTAAVLAQDQETESATLPYATLPGATLPGATLPSTALSSTHLPSATLQSANCQSATDRSATHQLGSAELCVPTYVEVLKFHEDRLARDTAIAHTIPIAANLAPVQTGTSRAKGLDVPGGAYTHIPDCKNTHTAGGVIQPIEAVAVATSLQAVEIRVTGNQQAKAAFVDTSTTHNPTFQQPPTNVAIVNSPNRNVEQTTFYSYTTQPNPPAVVYTDRTEILNGHQRTKSSILPNRHQPDVVHPRVQPDGHPNYSFKEMNNKSDIQHQPTDSHVVHPSVQPDGHPNSNLGAMNIPSSVHHDQKQTPAVLPAVKSKGQSSKEPLLAPIDYGVPCGVCNKKSIWQPGASRCFDCLGNKPSQALRQEVIRRAMAGIWSCSNCYHESDKSPGTHCQTCTQRQVDKNARRKARQAAGETWVPGYVQNGGVQKPKVKKAKGSSKSSREAKIAAIKKGLNRK